MLKLRLTVMTVRIPGAHTAVTVLVLSKSSLNVVINLVSRRHVEGRGFASKVNEDHCVSVLDDRAWPVCLPGASLAPREYLRDLVVDLDARSRSYNFGATPVDRSFSRCIEPSDLMYGLIA
jgi:hypothetical protein